MGYSLIFICDFPTVFPYPPQVQSKASFHACCFCWNTFEFVYKYLKKEGSLISAKILRASQDL